MSDVNQLPIPPEKTPTAAIQSVNVNQATEHEGNAAITTVDTSVAVFDAVKEGKNLDN